MDIHTFGDLLEHYPYRYLDSTQVQNIKSINPNQEYVQLKGTLINIFEEGSGFKRRLKATLTDQSGQLELVWFQGIPWIKKNLVPNKAYAVFGKVTVFNGSFSITHPEIEPVESHTPKDALTLQPVYPTTEKLRSRGLSNRAFARLLQALVEKLSPADVPEIIPQNILQQYGLIGRFDALVNIHFPQSETHRQLAEQRLKWEELFLTQMRIARLKIHHHKQAGWIFEKVGEKFNAFFAEHLPFELTNAQKRVLREIRHDTQTGTQMNRLVQGDVGSGKTMIALMSMLLALDNGFQSCLMAPTEILAHQHVQSFRELLAPLQIPVALLTGSVKGKEKKQILEGLAKGLIPFVIGTHALVEDTVRFHNLGIAIIDEQHRFGVTQRARLWQKNQRPPHILVMTATPIPRTLAMTVYGDLDISVIDELPPGRKPVQTIHRSENYRPKVMQFIREEIDKGRQVYIVYPLIDESDKLAYESLNANYEQVKAWFPEHKYNIGMVHGRQSQDERERNMKRFINGEAHILVATTVIEVGVNVPNATVMVVESAERFGLSQLHQLRGRVGRGADKSYCVLLTGYELSQESRRRMSIMVQTTDGFVIAEEDLKLRGPGDLYGTRQSGALHFKIADIIHDGAIMEETKAAAQALLSADPGMEKAMHQPLRVALQQTKNGLTHSWNKIS